MAQVIVISNEKGGSGKTTLAINLIITLLEMGYSVASVDLDHGQQSLSRYINNRRDVAQMRKLDLLMPTHMVLKPSALDSVEELKREEANMIYSAINELSKDFDFVVVDTPGYLTNMGTHVCALADLLITPVNESFLDVDGIGRMDPYSPGKISSGSYSAMLWDQKLERAQRYSAEMNWYVVRNRMSSLDTINGRKVHETLTNLSKRLGFKIAPGFSDRVIFKELFPYGLTLHDADKTDIVRFSSSLVLAREELRNFAAFIGVKRKIEENSENIAAA